jgi:protein-S-isoprenylcysteine O-methyltransferase Ste14
VKIDLLAAQFFLIMTNLGIALVARLIGLRLKGLKTVSEDYIGLWLFWVVSLLALASVFVAQPELGEPSQSTFPHVFFACFWFVLQTFIAICLFLSHRIAFTSQEDTRHSVAG